MPYIEFHRWILAAVLAMARIGGAFAVCPALTDSMIPGVARRVAVLALSCVAIPFIKDGMPPGEPNMWMFGVVAFQEALIGFLVYLPFIAIDIIVSNILLAMGMMMVSPVTISLPFKLLLFVMANGWTLLIQGLIRGYVI